MIIRERCPRATAGRRRHTDTPCERIKPPAAALVADANGRWLGYKKNAPVAEIPRRELLFCFSLK